MKKAANTGFFLFLVLLFAFSAASAAPSVPALPADLATVRVPLEEGLTATLSETHGINLEATPRHGEGADAFAARLCGDAGLASRIAERSAGSHMTTSAVSPLWPRTRPTRSTFVE